MSCQATRRRHAIASAFLASLLGVRAHAVDFAREGRVLQCREGTGRIGDVAMVGVPAEYFTGLGLDLKARSPFKNTYIAELANDSIGYLPDQGGYKLGTGERIADEAVKMLEELARAK